MLCFWDGRPKSWIRLDVYGPGRRFSVQQRIPDLEFDANLGIFATLRRVFMRFLVRSMIPLLTVWALAAPAAAQIDQGRLTGTIRDAQGGVLPGVTVTAKSPAPIGTRSVVSESAGTYSIASLPSGEYELTF